MTPPALWCEPLIRALANQRGWNLVVGEHYGWHMNKLHLNSLARYWLFRHRDESDVIATWEAKR